ncbi:MAG: hypothetical protein VX910_05610 [Candidatus Latescibacterota bacterium]|nr:hypothetical protein [Candidatus Latescibacterota bacterium]
MSDHRKGDFLELTRIGAPTERLSVFDLPVDHRDHQIGNTRVGRLTEKLGRLLIFFLKISITIDVGMINSDQLTIGIFG